MKCKNCGADLVSDAKFCVNCGTSVDDNKKANVTNASNSYEDEELLKIYIGNNYEKIIKKGFNFPAFFIGLYYLLYRKCYAYFFILLFVTFTFPIFLLPAAIFLGIKFNELYITQAKNEITKLKLYNSYNLEEAIRRKGGTSLLGPILYIVINVVIVLLVCALIALIVYSISGTKVKLLDDYDIYEKFNDDYEEVDVLYNVGNLRYSVPSTYKELYHSSYKASYTYYGGETCHFEINTVGEYEDIELEEETINGIEYYVHKEENENEYLSRSSKYYTSYNNKKYEILFNSSNDINDKCLNDQNNIINSISFKDEV